jgi:hypothetical protein
MHIYNFFYNFCYQLANKTRNLLFAIQLCMYLPTYLHYLWSAPEKVRPKKNYFSSVCEYVKLPFSLRVPKNNIGF